jgi:predicted RNase H-like HicB family nuclease
MEFKFVLTDYIEQAMAQAVYEELEEDSFAGRVPPCLGVIAFAPTLAECKEELQSVLEEWMLTGFKLGDELPVIAGIDLNLPPQSSLSDTTEAARLAKIIAYDLYNDQLDLSARVNAPGGSWSRMPEVNPLLVLQKAADLPDRTGRLFLTFIAALDRARDAMRLWRAGGNLFQAHPELFEPSKAAAVSLPVLNKLLSEFRVSQRHGPDSKAWQTIARSLSDGNPSPVFRVIEDGVGDAVALLHDLQSKVSGRNRFPMLRGPKIGPMWVRMMAAPGKARIDGIDTIPVAIDVHVRRVTENLGVTDTEGYPIEKARPIIQEAWHKAVAATDIGGPKGIAGTCAALDPALWFFGKHGCSHCENVGYKTPISRACDNCIFPFSDTKPDGIS